MKNCWLALATATVLGIGSAQAGPFNQGIGDAMYYGPYTGGHGYSYNTAYGYGFAFSSADTWRRDPFAYPAGVYPYRPYERPISCTIFPKPAVPYISVPGPDGLPILLPSAVPAEAPTVIVPGTPAPVLQPVPVTATAPGCATIRVSVPEAAEVWIEKEKTTQKGSERVFQSPPLTPGKTQIYSIRAKWNDGGREVEQFRVVGVRAGETAKVTFTKAQP
jgi:uncharacterized protein (TIGR03000 family)